jgi:hypothetical protein
MKQIEDYRNSSLLQCAIEARFFVESTLSFFAPSDGWPPQLQMVGKKLEYLYDLRPKLKGCLDVCSRINTLSRESLYENRKGPRVTEATIGTLMDDIYEVASYIRVLLPRIERFRDDVDRAESALSGSGVDSDSDDDDSIEDIIVSDSKVDTATQKLEIEIAERLKADKIKFDSWRISAEQEVEIQYQLMMRNLEQSSSLLDTEMKSYTEKWINTKRYNLQNSLQVSQQIQSNLSMDNKKRSKDERKRLEKLERSAKERERQRRLNSKKQRRRQRTEMATFVAEDEDWLQDLARSMSKMLANVVENESNCKMTSDTVYKLIELAKSNRTLEAAALVNQALSTMSVGNETEEFILNEGHRGNISDIFSKYFEFGFRVNPIVGLLRAVAHTVNWTGQYIVPTTFDEFMYYSYVETNGWLTAPLFSTKARDGLVGLMDFGLSNNASVDVIFFSFWKGFDAICNHESCCGGREMLQVSEDNFKNFRGVGYMEYFNITRLTNVIKQKI